MDNNQLATSPSDQMASETQPKTFFSLPRELRDRIYELCYCEPHLAVFAGRFRASDYDGPKNPEMIAQVASKHSVLYPAIYPLTPQSTDSNMRQNDVFTVSSNHATMVVPALMHTGVNWSKSLTGILYANKQISSEAAPYLYQSCTFFFEDLEMSKRFLEIVRPADLESILKVFIYYPDELEIIYNTHFTFMDHSVPMRRSSSLLCKKIAETMPKIKELTVWIGKIKELENDGIRCDEYERALLQFSALEELKTISVKKYGDVFDNSGDEDARWDGSNAYTVEGVKEIIKTGDHTALDRMRKAFEEARDGE